MTRSQGNFLCIDDVVQDLNHILHEWQTKIRREYRGPGIETVNAILSSLSYILAKEILGATQFPDGSKNTKGAFALLAEMQVILAKDMEIIWDRLLPYAERDKEPR